MASRRRSEKVRLSAKAASIAGAYLLSAAAVCGSEGRKVIVKTTLGPPMVLHKPHEPTQIIRGVSLAVTNNYTQPITALVIWGDESKKDSQAEDPVTTNAYFDSVIHENQQPIMPGQTRTEKSSDPKTRLRAAVFADGSTFGDSVWSERIFRHRQLYLAMIGRAIGCLEAFLLPQPNRAETLQKLSPCPWELNAPASTSEERNISFPIGLEVAQALGRPEREVEGPAVGFPGLGWYPVARFTEVAQKLRGFRARIAASISPQKGRAG